jgi:hypothetical protein
LLRSTRAEKPAIVRCNTKNSPVLAGLITGM